MPHRFFSPGITQNGILPLALDRSTAQGHEHRFFFFCELDLICCHRSLLRLLPVLCLLDPLYLCLCCISLRQKVCGPTVCVSSRLPRTSQRNGTRTSSEKSCFNRAWQPVRWTRWWAA